MIDKLKEIVEQEEKYVLSLVEASDKVESDQKEKIQHHAQGVLAYYKRISERIQKEIIDVYSANDD